MRLYLTYKNTGMLTNQGQEQLCAQPMRVYLADTNTLTNQSQDQLCAQPMGLNLTDNNTVSQSEPRAALCPANGSTLN